MLYILGLKLYQKYLKEK